MASAEPTKITIRAPQQRPVGYHGPGLDFLAGKWLVTHSSLPMWKTKRNVVITYTALGSSADDSVMLDDLVTYQALGSDKVKSVHGKDTMCVGAQRDEWDWRGKDWLVKLVTSHWQVLGWGQTSTGEQWAVTYFAKTVFTPAGVDVYARSATGLGAETVDQIKRAIEQLDSPELKTLARSIFEIKHDGQS